MLKASARAFIVIIVSVALLAGLVVSPVSAQDFSGSDISNYYCPVLRDKDNNPVTGTLTDRNGDFVCTYLPGTGFSSTKALPKPPTLRQVEYWFVRILYVIWALAGIFFALILGYIGWLKLTSFNNEFALAEVVKRFRNWALGFALVFLSYPILNTFFNVLGLRDSECFNNLQLPAFQFFFPRACNLDYGYSDCVSACYTITNESVRLTCLDSCEPLKPK